MPDDSPSPLWDSSIAAITKFHAASKMFTGRRLWLSYPTLKALCAKYHPATALDYGCGKTPIWLPQADDPPGVVATADLGLSRVDCYDPGVPGYDSPLPPPQSPEGRYDAVVANDVIEYVPAPDVPRVLDELFGRAGMFVLLATSVHRPTKDCVVDPDPWPKTKDFWLAAIDAAATKRPDVNWFLRLEEGERKSPRLVYGGRGGYHEFLSFDQLT